MENKDIRAPIITDVLLNSGIVVKPRGRNIFPNVIGIAGRFLIKGTIPESEDVLFNVMALFLNKK
jgi:hypothetical protein